MIIQTQAELDEICQKLSGKSYIAIDTEFLRDKTFYPRLCLIQLSSDDVDAVAVDPIAYDLDYSRLYDLLQNENVVKVFHAARQDLEIFYNLTGKVPHPIFDTQVAAMVCGYGDSIAYHRLVQDITGNSLSKNAQFTDWSKRPLTEKQINYALDDVIYLRDVYKSLVKRLAKQNREHWVKEEMAVLTNPETYDMPVEDAWKRIKIRSDKPKVLIILKQLATWREKLARHKDIPRGRIIKDDALADIAVYMPKDVGGLQRIRNVPKDVANGKTGEKILKLVQEALDTPQDEWPKVDRHEPFPKWASPILEMLKLLLKINASQGDVAAKIIASSSDLERLILEQDPDVAALRGWRHEIFGKDAIALKEGRLMLGLKKNKIIKNYTDQ